MRHGLNVSVVHWFGNSVCLRPKVDSLGLLKTISRKAKASIFFFAGRFGLPIPTRDPIVMVIGEGVLNIKKIPDPTSEQVDKMHAKIVTAHKKVFNDFRKAYGQGFESKELTICS